MKKILIIMGVLIALLATLYFFGFYPALRINDEWISRARISSQASILRRIQEKAASESNPDLELIALQNILKDSLIRDGLLKEFDRETLQGLLKDEVDSLDAEELQSFSKLLGLSRNESLDFWLMPSIREDLLENKLILKGEEFINWLEESKKSARVTLFSREFRWDGTSFSRN